MNASSGIQPEASEGYDPAVIEPKWQARWRELHVFDSVRDPARPKYYCYNPAPYVTGALHMGHVRNYACGDFVARYQRLRGAAVLYTIGFDALGLPTEMAAIRHRTDPERWTAACLEEMKRQLEALGCSFDWRRSFVTSDPEYYRWTQWLFLQLHQKGLIYSARGRALWCPVCRTSLARAQVLEGRCWICGGEVQVRRLQEWRLRISACLEELLCGLEEMRDLNGLADQGQKTLIGALRGVQVDLDLPEGRRRVSAFMESKSDWRWPCVLLVHRDDEETLAWLPPLDPGAAAGDRPAGDRPAGEHPAGDHPLLPAVQASFPECRYAGAVATEVRSGRSLPVFIVSAVEPAYTDRPLVFPLRRPGMEAAGPAAAGSGTVPEFPPLTIYRQKDFSISRQRLWGTPIPIVWCEACGEVPVPLDSLPVAAPRVVFDPALQSLRREEGERDERGCPRCGGAARLDAQVLDCHMDSIWHPFRPCAGEQRDFLFDPVEMRYWMPADIIQFGRDVIPFMLDLRFLSRFLHRLGHVPFQEFCRDVLAHGLVLHEGRKMSKHLENVVRPDAVIREFGADSLRFYVLAHAEPRSDFRWSDDGIERYHAALASHWELVREFAREPGRAAAPAPGAAEAGAVPAPLGRYAAIFLRKAAREVALLESSVEGGRYDRYAGALWRLLGAMQFYRANHHAGERHAGFGRMWRALVENSIIYLAPVAPHLAEECWQILGRRESMYSGARFPENQAAALNALLAQEGRRQG